MAPPRTAARTCLRRGESAGRASLLPLPDCFRIARRPRSFGVRMTLPFVCDGVAVPASDGCRMKCREGRAADTKPRNWGLACGNSLKGDGLSRWAGYPVKHRQGPFPWPTSLRGVRLGKHERCLHPRTAMRPVGGVRRPMSTREGVRGRRWQVISWPSAKPDRRLGPGRVPEPPPDRPGMKPFPSELEPPEADRALETIDAGTDKDVPRWTVGR